jgi:succinoglycan biosynthesis transport protein ExoP
VQLIPQPWPSSPDGPEILPHNPELARLESKVDQLLGTLAGPPIEPPRVGPLTYWRALKRRKFLVVFVALACAAAGWFVSQRQERMYRAHTLVELLEPGQQYMNMRNFNSGSAPLFTQDVYVDTQVDLLQSRSLLKAVANRLGMPWPASTVAPQGKGALTGSDTTGDQELPINPANIGVSPLRGTRLINVTYEAKDPKLAADVLNALTAEYIQQDVDTRVSNSEQMRVWLLKQLEDVKAKLEESEGRLQTYARSSGLLLTSPKGNAGEEADDKLQYLATELSEAQAKRASLEARYLVAQAKAADPASTNADSGQLHDIASKLVELRRELASLNTTFTPDYYKVQQLKAEVTQLEAEQTKESSRWLAQIRDGYETELRHEQLIEAEYKQQADLVGDQASKAIHYNVLKREVETNRNLYDALLGGMKEAGVNASARVRNARVVDAAEPPQQPYRPTPVRNAAIGLVSGLLLGAAFVVLKDTSDRRLRGPGAASNYLNVPELGSIPSARRTLISKPGSEMARWTQVNGTRSRPSNGGAVGDALHSIATSILFSGGASRPPKVIVMTSAAVHEGKTTVIGNLAMMMSKVGQRVVVVDGDLRNPRLHNIYGLSNEQGLSELLADSKPLAHGAAMSLAKQTEIPRLYFLSSGAARDNIATVLHTRRLIDVVDQLREEFDLVLIDTPPVLRFADARVFGKLADAVILVVRSGHTTRDMAMAAKVRLTEDGLPVFGTILTDWDGKDSAYEYA